MFAGKNKSISFSYSKQPYCLFTAWKYGNVVHNYRTDLIEGNDHTTLTAAMLSDKYDTFDIHWGTAGRFHFRTKMLITSHNCTLFFL